MSWVFVGLGQMGLPMAQRLSSVVDVVAYDARNDVTTDLNVVKDPRALKDHEVMVTCLPNGKVVEDALFGEKNLVAGLAEGAVVFDTSTTSHTAACNISERLAQRGIHFLDAPVSGMQKRAEDGTLTMMIGGDPALVAAHKDSLSAMASKVLHVGPVGTGQLAKLINQLLFDINMAALAEIMPVSTRLGLKPEQITDIVNTGTGRSYASEFFLPNILEGIFDQGYPMQAAYKDLVSGSEIMANNSFPAPVLAAATATYQHALAEGYGESDKGAMIRVFERLLKTSFRKSDG
ncbi:3-hydroxyisobutyrate dehydrogenase [Sulfitobacter noctilucicola]|uniref:3-hydroxyisobutyrate dehydrogenase-like beta-hydroxyacid dehydrogenase n=1 Tax=Sulfitobacter noctilucicola TaxID=1342301 RepID=A0A7W6Q4T2_9RHOB|nr:NAD(P)-dependent oxidoreductase [Sulfitobacter noctilucicola]KIN63523.1 3-hydroxyisobutyrate dehydrogenase [Sulfitobacter noctilucicola]MBB4174968.1 3-hydroxyisobutyrate dehydrogenase-like beta-hydroxyacid dehydrogenase [Sulfitobacter noctilucicola]